MHTLRRWNEVLHLKPNLVGIGFNLNAAIEPYLDDLELAGRPVKVRATGVSSVADSPAPGAGAWEVVTREATRLLRRLREIARRP